MKSLWNKIILGTSSLSLLYKLFIEEGAANMFLSFNNFCINFINALSRGIAVGTILFFVVFIVMKLREKALI